MIETGAIISLQDNASATAKRVAEGFQEVTKGADGINSALDPRVLEEYNNKLTQIGEAYSKLNRGMQQSQSQQMQHAQQVFAGMSSSVVQAGRGDVAGGALSGVKSLAGLAGKISPAVAGGLAAVAGVGIAGNALAGIYGERAGPAGDIARLSGDMGTDIAANTLALRDAMSSTVDSVAKFGKTFEEGAAAAQVYLRAGGKDFGGSQAASYSLAYGADFNRLAAFEGTTERYGMTGGLAAIDALRKAQGLKPGQFEEVLGGFQDIRSGRLSRGITGGESDLLRSMEFFGKAGATWQGALGAQKVQGMNQAVAGAAGLQQQSDLFLYRAAAGITPGGSMIDIKKRMEGGLTQEMFKGLMGEFGQMGYGDTESILTLSRMFGLSTTDAEALYGLRGQGLSGTQFENLGGLGAGAGATIETGYQANIEGVKQWVSELGEGFYDLRAEGVDATIEAFKNLVDVTETITTTVESFFDIGTMESSIREQAIKDKERNDARREVQIATDFRHSLGVDQMFTPGVSGFYKRIKEAEAAGVDITDIYTATGSAYQRSIGDRNLDQSELSILAKLLQDLIDVNKTTADNTGKDAEFEDKSGATPYTGGGVGGR